MYVGGEKLRFPKYVLQRGQNRGGWLFLLYFRSSIQVPIYINIKAELISYQIIKDVPHKSRNMGRNVTYLLGPSPAWRVRPRVHQKYTNRVIKIVKAETLYNS